MIHVGKAQTRWQNDLNCTQNLVSWNLASVNRSVNSLVTLPDHFGAEVDPQNQGFSTKACTGPLLRVFNICASVAFAHSLYPFRTGTALVSMESAFPVEFNFGELWHAIVASYFLTANCLDCPELWGNGQPKSPKQRKLHLFLFNPPLREHTVPHKREMVDR